MAKVTMLDKSGASVGDIELKDEIFGFEINQYAVHEVVKNYLANQRQGTQSAKTRSEVRGGGRKPFRQKGTGRGRQGSTTSPNHVGGGIVFAPKPRDYRYAVSKKVKRIALKSVLSDKVNEGELIVIDSLTFETPKTKDMKAFLAAVNSDTKKTLIVTAEKDANVIRSASSIPGVFTSNVGQFNVYEILNCDSFILTQDAVKKIEEVYS
ncbi:MAG: 50S ribosomal protein L4 [Clostridiales Family XIII bacterium]|jgi:large subunit ribosomal protein L4|nr:50S ribosomal protein L4 [Clostridiales Family XIII bacterium]